MIIIMIAVIKYNAGNIGSVANALGRIGERCVITDDHRTIREADRVIFPGVGEASNTMKYLIDSGLNELIPTLTQPVLGICLGMQLMCSWSEEGETPGLGIFPEQVVRFRGSMKVPHMGWNAIHFDPKGLYAGLEPGAYVYFVHSYYAESGASAEASCYYGVRFSAALSKANFHAVQFHPEKSGLVGERILKNFIAL